MRNGKKFLTGLFFLLLFVLISPIIITWLGIFLSTVIKIPAVILIVLLLIVTILIAWFGRVGR